MLKAQKELLEAIERKNIKLIKKLLKTNLIPEKTAIDLAFKLYDR